CCSARPWEQNTKEETTSGCIRDNKRQRVAVDKRLGDHSHAAGKEEVQAEDILEQRPTKTDQEIIFCCHRSLIHREIMLAQALFFTVVFAAVRGGAGHMKVQTEEIIWSECQQSVTLFCNISTTHKHFTILNFFWMNSLQEKLCTHSDTLNTETSDHFHCQYTDLKQLALTIQSPRNDEKGEYVCKLFTDHGHDGANTTLLLQACPVKRVDQVSLQATSSILGNQASTLQRKQTSLVLLLGTLLLAFP
ncbi:hypothetical protein AOLI_G00003620, partial [Acnodon oligacanthus]